jgi:hypothetical protein
MLCGVCHCTRTQEGEFVGTRAKCLDGFHPEGARLNVRALVITDIICPS